MEEFSFHRIKGVNVLFLRNRALNNINLYENIFFGTIKPSRQNND